MTALTQPKRRMRGGGTASTPPPHSARQLGTTPKQLYGAVGRGPQRVQTPVPQALETSAANCWAEQEARDGKDLMRVRSRTPLHRETWPRGTVTVLVQDVTQLDGDNLHKYEGEGVQVRLIIIKGIYVTISVDLICIVGLIGMHEVIGGQGMRQEQGHLKLGLAAGGAELKEAIMYTIFQKRPAATVVTEMKLDVCRRCRRTRSMCYHGRNLLRGYTFLTSRTWSPRPRGSARRGGASHLLNDPFMTCQFGHNRRTQAIVVKLWARGMSKPRSTRRRIVAEFEGGISRLGRGETPLQA